MQCPRVTHLRWEESAPWTVRHLGETCYGAIHEDHAAAAGAGGKWPVTATAEGLCILCARISAHDFPQVDSPETPSRADERGA